MANTEARPDAHSLLEGDRTWRASGEGTRVFRRVDRLRCMALGFAEFSTNGQPHADEIFRMFADADLGMELVSMRAVPGMQQMIRGAEALRDEQGGQRPLLK